LLKADDKKNGNVYDLNSGKAVAAIKLMHERKVIEQIPDPEDRVMKLLRWKDEAKKYWVDFV